MSIPRKNENYGKRRILLDIGKADSESSAVSTSSFLSFMPTTRVYIIIRTMQTDIPIMLAPQLHPTMYKRSTTY